MGHSQSQGVLICRSSLAHIGNMDLERLGSFERDPPSREMPPAIVSAKSSKETVGEGRPDRQYLL